MTEPTDRLPRSQRGSGHAEPRWDRLLSSEQRAKLDQLLALVAPPERRRASIACWKLLSPKPRRSGLVEAVEALPADPQGLMRITVAVEAWKEITTTSAMKGKSSDLAGVVRSMMDVPVEGMESYIRIHCEQFPFITAAFNPKTLEQAKKDPQLRGVFAGSGKYRERARGHVRVVSDEHEDEGSKPEPQSPDVVDESGPGEEQGEQKGDNKTRRFTQAAVLLRDLPWADKRALMLPTYRMEAEGGPGFWSYDKQIRFSGLGRSTYYRKLDEHPDWVRRDSVAGRKSPDIAIMPSKEAMDGAREWLNALWYGKHDPKPPGDPRPPLYHDRRRRKGEKSMRDLWHQEVRESNLPGRARVLTDAMGILSGQAGTPFRVTTNDELSQLSGLSPASVRRSHHELEGGGWIVVERAYGGRGKASNGLWIWLRFPAVRGGGESQG